MIDNNDDVVSSLEPRGVLRAARNERWSTTWTTESYIFDWLMRLE